MQQRSEKWDIWVIRVLLDLLHVDIIVLVMKSDLKQVLFVHLCDYRDEVVHHNGDEEEATYHPIDLLEGVENHRKKGDV